MIRQSADKRQDCDNRVVVVGATGFLGGELVAELRGRGCEVLRVARGLRAPRTVPELRPDVEADICRPETLSGLVQPGDTVVHLVGISPMRRPLGGRRTYRQVHLMGTRNLLREAERAGASRFVYLSAHGVRRDAVAAYAETKARAEAMVRRSTLRAIIVAPSLLLGGRSEVMRLLCAISRLPVVPLPQIDAPFRPLHVREGAREIADAVCAPEPPQELPLTGPERLSFREIVERSLRARGTWTLLLPTAATRLLVWGVSRLKIPGLPADLDRMLAIDNAGDPPYDMRNP